MTARERIAGSVANYVDERTGAAKWMKKNLTKVFPDHWSFLLGEIVLYSFIILLLSGTYLTFWFDPSQREVIYDGSYEPLQGLEMSAAYASTLDISFEVRGGLLMRQIHHWSALIFIAGMVVHLMCIYARYFI
jgi:ubiquinol-cytochrome c reductase cytochrome b subunit